MSIKMETPHVAEYGPDVSTMVEGDSFIIGRSQPSRVLREEDEAPRMDWIRKLYEHLSLIHISEPTRPY